ncbi:MAG TPA: YqiA/YcfP family alpha/beta fold hydrolase [Burkholderiales bacterium]|nr:YqiA/YcfP family alpha/beta fold hydrolase [Burkholderiales bacterium]
MIFYLHGFNSSPQSHKAQLLGRFMAQRGLASKYACPALPPLASHAIREIESRLPREAACFVGSSLGGFYATHLAEKHGAKAVLINPAIKPHVGLRAYLGPQKNLHTGEPYELTEAHLREWEALHVSRVRPDRYLLLVETGDEVLDYREAVQHYAGAQQVVVQGGDHSLQSFPDHLPRILEFAGLRVGR